MTLSGFTTLLQVYIAIYRFDFTTSWMDVHHIFIVNSSYMYLQLQSTLINSKVEGTKQITSSYQYFELTKSWRHSY